MSSPNFDTLDASSYQETPPAPEIDTATMSLAQRFFAAAKHVLEHMGVSTIDSPNSGLRL